MVADALKRTKPEGGTLNVNSFAKALESARIKTPAGEISMRASDHQALLPMVVSTVTKDAKFKADDTDIGFKPVKVFLRRRGCDAGTAELQDAAAQLTRAMAPADRLSDRIGEAQHREMPMAIKQPCKQIEGGERDNSKVKGVAVALTAAAIAGLGLSGCGGGGDGESPAPPPPAPLTKSCVELNGMVIPATSIGLPTTAGVVTSATVVPAAGTGPHSCRNIAGSWPRSIQWTSPRRVSNSRSTCLPLGTPKQ
jgi:hypothetical protein